MLGHETCKQIYVRKNEINTTKQKIYLLLVEMGHHALAWRSTSLENGGAMAQWEDGCEGG